MSCLQFLRICLSFFASRGLANFEIGPEMLIVPLSLRDLLLRLDFASPVGFGAAGGVVPPGDFDSPVESDDLGGLVTPGGLVPPGGFDPSGGVCPPGGFAPPAGGIPVVFSGGF